MPNDAISTELYDLLGAPGKRFWEVLVANPHGDTTLIHGPAKTQTHVTVPENLEYAVILVNGREAVEDLLRNGYTINV